MKKHLSKFKILLSVAIMLCCVIPKNVHAEEHKFHCYPSEEQIQQYKKDGTWEKRQEYVKKLNYSAPSQELLYNALQREYGFVRYTTGDNIPENWKGMQVTGDAKMLLVRVEFADVTFEDSKIYSEEEFYEMVMGDTDTGVFPYESLNAYYKRSSYNKLNILSDQVYSCTLSKNRDAYELADSGEQNLIKEVLEILDSTVDFTNYDANQDGQLDGICINFAGESTGWGSTWWSHKFNFLDSSIAFDGVTPAGYIFLETDFRDESYGTQTLIHETGHMLGLPDYYGRTTEGIGTTDMMNNNVGDHNGFSKWLLGWIEEDNILKINREFGNTDVELVPISSESLGDNKLIAVIAPDDTSIYSEYFVVQYDEYTGNQSINDLEKPGYRIFHVDAHLNDEGTDFKYDNLYARDRALIQSAPIIEGENNAKRHYYVEGDAFTPDTNESSAFYGGSILGFTGIELTDFVTGDTPSFKVSFREKEIVDGKLELQLLGETPLNMAKLTLLSNKPLIDAGTDQEAYLEDSDKNQYPLLLSVEDGKQQIEISYIAITNSLKPETEYTLVIPAGMFQIDTDVYSEECRLTVKTGIFPEIKSVYTYDPNVLTDVFVLDDTKSGFIQIIDKTEETWLAQLHVFEETKEIRVIDIKIPFPTPYTEVMSMKGVACSDGTIAVEVRSGNPVDYSTISNFYKIDTNGTVLAGPFSTYEKLNIFPVGNIIKGTMENSGAAGAPEIENDLKLEVYTIDFENEPTSRLINMQKYMSKVYPLDDESYIVIQDLEQGHTASIFNIKDELIKSMNLSENINGSFCAAVASEDKLAIMYSSYLENDKHEICVMEYDMNGTYLGTHKIIRFNGWKSINDWKFEKTSWGYSLSNYTSDQPYTIYFLNEEFELISTLQVPDNSCSGTHMGSRHIVKWYDMTTYRYSVAITEPIVADTPADNDTSTDNDTLKPEKPSDEAGAGNNSVPDTGDRNNLWLLLFAIAISGIKIAESVKRN